MRTRTRSVYPPASREMIGQAMKLFDLKGRVALVTGGNGGIGLGMAAGLAQARAAITVVGRSQSQCQSAARQPHCHALDAAFIAAHVAVEAGCPPLVRVTVGR